MKMLMLGLFLGLALGAAGVWFGGDAIRAQLGGGGTEYVVVSERREEERLVLVLRAEGESVLATFRARAADVDELVAVGDTVRLAAPSEAVFADDVAILSVRPAGEHVEPPPADAGVPADASVPEDAVPDDAAADEHAAADHS